LSEPRVIEWNPPGPVARDFMLDESFFAGLRGPVGSGKSVTCCMKLMREAQRQEPGPDGKRRVKTAVVRNTYPMLRTTTIATWLEWFPENYFGRFVWTPPFTHYIRIGDVEWDVLFLALDRDEDVRKLLSAEFTNAWINEAREVSKPIVDAITMRVARFPPMRDGGPTRPMILADTNPPPEHHWWPILSGEVPVPEYYTEEQARMMVKPKDWKFYAQPPAAYEIKDERGFVVDYEPNEESENRKHLHPKYYERIIAGKDPAWVRVYVCNQLGEDKSGKPVFPEYREEYHRREFEVDPLIPITIGMDFGLTPSAIFCQDVPRETFRVFDELCFVDMTLERFAEEVLYRVHKWQRELNADLRVDFFGDPAGDSRSAYDPTGRTAFMILRDNGINARPTATNDPLLRVEAVSRLLTRQAGGYPAFILHPRCAKLHSALNSGYKYRQRKTTQGVEYDDVPLKNEYSHPADALQYAVLGAGHGRNRPRGSAAKEPVNARVPYDVFSRDYQPRQYGGSKW